MTGIELVPINELDRRYPIERRLDDLLKRYARPGFKNFDAVASTNDLLEAYLAVVWRRNKIIHHFHRRQVSEVALVQLSFITQNTRSEIDKRLAQARVRLANNESKKADEILACLQKNMSDLADRDQAEISSAKREPNVMRRIVSKLHKKNPDITSTEVKAALNDMVGDGVVLAIDEEYVEIDVTPNGSSVRKIKPYKLSGIPNILGRVKNPKN
jgi:hypothetical protein